MCRTYLITFGDCGHVAHAGGGHRYGTYDRAFPAFQCTEYPNCNDSDKLTQHPEEGFCLTCLRSVDTISRFHPLNEREIRLVTHLLDFAHLYDSTFSGHLNEADGLLINTLNGMIGKYITDLNTPYLTESEFRLFEQIRTASIKFNLTKRDRKRPEMLLRRLDLLLAPVPHTKDTCMICMRSLGENGDEAAVRMPCRHVIGRECLESWILSWDPDTTLAICPLDRDNFNLDRASLNVMDEVGQEVLAGDWLRVLKAEWQTALDDEDKRMALQEQRHERDRLFQARYCSVM